MADENGTGGGRSYLSVILGVLAVMPKASVTARRRVYDRMQAQLETMFATRQPPLEDDARDIEFRILRQTVRFVERDIRAGVDVFATGYHPEGLGEILAKIEQARAGLENRRRVLAERAEREEKAAKERADREIFEAAQADVLGRLRIALGLDEEASRDPGRVHRSPSGTTIVWSLFIHLLHSLQAEGRFTIVWILIQPMVLLTLISSAYFLMGTNHVLGMDVPTFSLLGAGTWIMCRMVIFRVSGQLAHYRFMLNFPMVMPLHQALAHALLYLVIYAVSMTLLVIAGWSIDMMSLPDDLLGVSMYFLGMWVCAISIGIYFGVIIGSWPFFARLTTVVERALQIFSAVYFVTEQLPEVYRSWVLWNPLAHGMQEMRGAYFRIYACSDASVAYFWVWVATLASIALVLEHWYRRHVQPV